jgi:hypothetical protein
LKTISSARAESDHAPGSATSDPTASWPEKSTSLTLLSVDSENAMASPATTRPMAGRATNGRHSATRTVSRARRKIAKVTAAMAAARRIVQPKSATSGWGKCGSCRAPIAMSLVLSPVIDPIPIHTSDPIPAASRPGTSTRGSLGPPSPDASMRITAAMIGDPKRNDTAANVAEAAITVRTSGGASRRSRSTARNPRPPPMAMRGASGPRTIPRPMLARAARITPGTAFGWVGAGLRPSAGT